MHTQTPDTTHYSVSFLVVFRLIFLLLFHIVLLLLLPPPPFFFKKRKQPPFYFLSRFLLFRFPFSYHVTQISLSVDRTYYKTHHDCQTVISIALVGLSLFLWSLYLPPVIVLRAGKGSGLRRRFISRKVTTKYLRNRESLEWKECSNK